MSISAQQVNALRQRTGVSMMQCKKALEEANGNEEKAIEILRKKGAAKAVEKSDRATKEGVVVTKIEGDKAAIVKLNCETDFVAKNEEVRAVAKKAAETAIKRGPEKALEEANSSLKELFTKLGENMSIAVQVMEGDGIADYVHTNDKVGALVKLSERMDQKARDIAMQITAMNPLVIRPEDVSEDDVAKERGIWKHQLLEEGKPEAIFDKIMAGKERKFREECALLKQAFVKDPEKTVEEFLDGLDVVDFIRMAI
ncbi:MAG: translation elongation factor Ts [Candidatus Peregrinibacteria bacterium]